MKNNDGQTVGPLGELAVRTMVWDKIAALALALPNALGLRVDFSGSGDSGSVEDEAMVIWEEGYHPTPSDLTTSDSLLHEIVLGGKPLSNLVAEISEPWTGTPGIPDWWNNEGGDGCVSWWLRHPDGEGDEPTDPVDRVIIMTVNQNITQQDTSYHNVTF